MIDYCIKRKLMYEVEIENKEEMRFLIEISLKEKFYNFCYKNT